MSEHLLSLLDLDPRLGDVVADRPLLGERLAEGDPLLEVVLRAVERTPGTGEGVGMLEMLPELASEEVQKTLVVTSWVMVQATTSRSATSESAPLGITTSTPMPVRSRVTTFGVTSRTETATMVPSAWSQPRVMPTTTAPAKPASSTTVDTPNTCGFQAVTT